ncbi:MAG: hypothetical protein V7K20_24120 [Nostoc sp.]
MNQVISGVEVINTINAVIVTIESKRIITVATYQDIIAIGTCEGIIPIATVEGVTIIIRIREARDPEIIIPITPVKDVYTSRTINN